MSYFDKYISLSTSQDIEQTMVESHNHLIQTILPLTEEQMLFKYEENKWSIKDLLQHLIDTERVFMYRAMCFARNDKSELPGFDENEFAAEAMADLKSKGQLLNEYIAVHKSTIMFYNTLPNEAMDRKG
ncbi:MAG: putative damage-inducible protein DinB, partial [Urechidicola sp.]